MAVLQIDLLGGFTIKAEGKSIPAVQSTRFQSFIAYLALHPDTPVPRQKLAFMFWPDASEKQARSNLRKLIFDLRHDLPVVDQFLSLSASTLRWRPDIQLQVDVETFLQAAEQAQESGQLEKAVDLYQGELLPGCYDEWVLEERQRLEDHYIQVLAKLIQKLEDEREYIKAIGFSHRLMQIVPLEEENYRQQMRLHALSGNRAGVVETYKSCAAILQRELEIEPSPLTQRLYQRLIKSDGNLNQFSPLPEHKNDYQSEWMRLQNAWRTAMAGHPHWAFLVGDREGRTQILLELTQWADRMGLPHAAVTCYPTDRDLAYAPLQAIVRACPLPVLEKIWLAEIARLLPEILVDHPNIDPPGPIKDISQRNRFYEAAARVVLQQDLFLLIINNLEWCDQDTLGWLTFLQRYKPEAHLLIVATLSDESLNDQPLLAEMIETLELERKSTRIDFTLVHTENSR